MEHQPILLNEVIEALGIKPNGIYVDCTFGRGGHSQAILKLLPKGRLIVLDQDQQAIHTAHLLQVAYPQITVVKTNFKHLKSVLKELDIQAVDGILMDLGVSSPQFDDPSRGFSYRFDAMLDMRMDQTQSLNAQDVVNNYKFEELVRIFRLYGEEAFAKQIARKIEAYRQNKRIESTLELVSIIKSALPSAVLSKKGHPAKQVFQALRIEVNAELDVLASSLEAAIQSLREDGRLAVITFHSLEDRMVKQSFIAHSRIDTPAHLPIIHLPQADYSVLYSKAILPSEKELEENSRARSAKLRVLRKN